MKRELLNILACPVCRTHPLELIAQKEDRKEVLEGKLRCPRCGSEYPIELGIPNMIPPDKRY